MENAKRYALKDYAWKGLAIVALLLVAGRAAYATYSDVSSPRTVTINAENWSGNLIVNQPAGSVPLVGSELEGLQSEEELSIGGPGYNQGMQVVSKQNFKNGFQINGVDAWTPQYGISTTVSTTLGYATNQPNTPRVSMNSASTTVCAVQNTSGVRRVVPSVAFLSTGSTGAGALTQFRAYISGNRADMNTTATGTLFKQALVDVTATGVQIFGGPVPQSYYLSSTVFGTGISSLPTTTLPLWDIGAWVNVTSSAITSSTGNCVFESYPLN